MTVYFGEFESKDDLVRSFYLSAEQLADVEILYAHYSNEGYEGYAHAIFRKEGQLYEVNGSHCSCYGLEDQWEPEETSVAALLARPNVTEEAKEILRRL